MDTAGLGLKEPEQINWDNHADGGSKYMPPPIPVDQAGKRITFYGVAQSIVPEVTDEGYRTYLLDPIKLVKGGPGVDGYVIRFTRASVKKFVNKKTGEQIEASMASRLLKAAGVAAKPQKNAEYDAAFKLVAGKPIPFTIDWEARVKDTGETVRGYENFPIDPATGQRKSILRAGDQYKDENGATQTLKAEVAFANARVQFYQIGKK
jgi:hypothetical protein